MLHCPHPVSTFFQRDSCVGCVFWRIDFNLKYINQCKTRMQVPKNQINHTTHVISMIIYNSFFRTWPSKTISPCFDTRTQDWTKGGCNHKRIHNNSHDKGRLRSDRRKQIDLHNRQINSMTKMSFMIFHHWIIINTNKKCCFSYTLRKIAAIVNVEKTLSVA